MPHIPRLILHYEGCENSLGLKRGANVQCFLDSSEVLTSRPCVLLSTAWPIRRLLYKVRAPTHWLGSVIVILAA